MRLSDVPGGSMTAPIIERMALLRRQRQAADRSAHCHFLARLRIMQGYFGAAKFYQCEAARWHVRACELRLECTATPYVQQIGRVKRWQHANLDQHQVIPMHWNITPYTGPRGPVVDLSIHGSKPMPDPETLREFSAGFVITVRGNCGLIHSSLDEWRKCRACETPRSLAKLFA